MTTLENHTDALISIGALASELGLSTDALRAWERRYGSPRSVRLPSGHRRYSRAEVLRMRLVTELVRHGARISEVIALTDEQLAARLEHIDDARSPELGRVLDDWLGRAKRYDGAGLAAAIASEDQRLGSVALVEERVAPFLVELGRRWADGRLDVRHEHFATRVVQDHLQHKRTSAHASWNGEARMLLATMQGESHGLGLEMAALLCARFGVEPVILGIDTPAAELARAAEETGVEFIGVSVSVANSGPSMDQQLTRLRALVPAEIEIVVGGAGTLHRRGPKGVRVCADMRMFSKWLQKRNKR